MTDKLPIQSHVAQKMSSLLHVVSRMETLKFIRAFWSIIDRQWSYLDRLRMDKIYRLMRCLVKEGFVFLQNGNFDQEELQIYLAILSQGPLSPTSAAGIIGHISDVYVEELQHSTPSPVSHHTHTALPPFLKKKKKFFFFFFFFSFFCSSASGGHQTPSAGTFLPASGQSGKQNHVFEGV